MPSIRRNSLIGELFGYGLKERFSGYPQSASIFCGAATDAAEEIRFDALTYLIGDYPQLLEAFTVVMDRAIHDPSPASNAPKRPRESYVREIAIGALFDHWADKPEILPLLEERAQNDPTDWLRTRAGDFAKKIMQKQENPT